MYAAIDRKVESFTVMETNGGGTLIIKKKLASIFVAIPTKNIF